jgi:hypothetical protein
MDILQPSKAMWVKVVIDFGKLLPLVACHSARLEGLIDCTMVPTITLAPHLFKLSPKKTRSWNCQNG